LVEFYKAILTLIIKTQNQFSVKMSSQPIIGASFATENTEAGKPPLANGH
jgi:hypothetical protein